MVTFAAGGMWAGGLGGIPFGQAVDFGHELTPMGGYLLGSDPAGAWQGGLGMADASRCIA